MGMSHKAQRGCGCRHLDLASSLIVIRYIGWKLLERKSIRE